MSSLPIFKDINFLKKAIQDNDPGRISGSLELYSKKYTHDKIRDYKSGLKDEAEKKLYDDGLKEYEDLIQGGIKILNIYIETNFRNFLDLDHDDKKLFLRVVEILVYTESFVISSLEEEELCKKLLIFMSTASKQNENIFQRIEKILTIEKIDYSTKDDNGMPQETMWIEDVLGDRRFFSDLLKNTYGRNYKALKDIFMRINKNDMPDELDLKLNCSILDTECSKFIPSGKFYFIAFPFNIHPIEDKIIEAFKIKFPTLQPKIARGILENRTALCQICEFILSSKFGVYVLNKYSCDNLQRHLPNPNVTLELGIALGLNRRYIMLVEKNTTVIADLAGLLRIEYDNVANIPEMIRQHDFTNFYNED